MAENAPAPRDVKVEADRPAVGPGLSTARPSGVLPWLVAAASLFVAANAGFYAWSLHTEVTSLRQLVADASARAETLRAQVAAMRRDSARLQRVVNVMSAPDVMRADLSGTGPGAGATGRAFWSRSQGLIFNAERLPVAGPTHVYQLWVIGGGDATSAGLLAQSPDGSIASAVAAPPGITAADTIAVTLEPAGPEQPKARGPVVLAGKTK